VLQVLLANGGIGLGCDLLHGYWPITLHERQFLCMWLQHIKAVKHYVGKTEHPADNYHLTVYIKQTICGVAISWCYNIVTLMFTETF